MKLIFVLLFISFSALGAPQSIEVWFLSNSKTALLQDLLNRPATVYRPETVELQCEMVGDLCFDPQYGLYKKDDINAEVAPLKAEDPKGSTISSPHSVDRELINCEKSNMFDIFCGKARAQAKQGSIKFDLWIDTSSSMREFDFEDGQGSCYRESFVRRLDQTCGFNEKVNVMMFDTSIKQAGNMGELCHTRGLNDVKRLMDWIERSDAKKLIIITDIHEFHKDFSDYIESKKGIFRGDKDPLTAKQLVNLADELAKSCK